MTETKLKNLAEALQDLITKSSRVLDLDLADHSENQRNIIMNELWKSIRDAEKAYQENWEE